MTFQRLTILLPVFNEIRTIREILAQVDAADAAGLEKELIIVDDGSTDGTREVLERLDGLKTPLRSLFHARNMGKGAALRTALTYATGDIILIQDGDLEYDPKEYPELLAPILTGRADVVYGSRTRGGKPVRDFSLLYLWGNKFVTFVTNLLYGAALTDMETCYKVFRADVIKNIQTQANGFEFEPEITAKVLKRGHKIVELPVSYYGRDKVEGKKLSWRDGISALWTLVKYRLVD
ncbi:MAG TPA: glycosyltransferase family 2 protein [Candidatus Methylomirabilis sp.]|nr:glycosyltransferase family 2 protein [Candidatus Methylomirabilis sp.]